MNKGRSSELAALQRRFEDQVDPARVLTPAERERRSVKAFKDYLFKRVFKSRLD